MILKTDLHLHVAGDPLDTWITDTADELVDRCVQLGFGAISITCHTKVVYPLKVVKRAARMGLIMIQGCEATIDGSHTLLYNFNQQEIDRIHSFEDLRSMRRKDQLIIAPHPYYPHPWGTIDHKKGGSLGKKLVENIDVFDAIEHSFFFTKHLNPNVKAIAIAKKYGKPIIANSDSHIIRHVGQNVYGFVDVKERSAAGVIDAIKKGRVTNHIDPIYYKQFLMRAAWVLTPNSLKKLIPG